MADTFISSSYIPQSQGVYGDRQVRTAEGEERVEEASGPVPVEAMSAAQGAHRQDMVAFLRSVGAQ
jgi:hypothetical protein